MVKESQSDRNDWRGCHSFTDIVCDGDMDTQNDVQRDGCLKMTGRYWYYYQIDNLFDWSDPAQPETTSCPILPGQKVNVLDVPFEKSHDSAITTAEDDSIPFRFTLDPRDRYVNPIKPQTPSSQLARKARQSQSPPMPSRAAPPPPPFETDAFMVAPTRAPPLPPSQPVQQPNFWTAYSNIPSSRPVSSHSAIEPRSSCPDQWWDDSAFMRPFTADDSLSQEIRDSFAPFTLPLSQSTPPRSSNRNSVPGLTATPSTISPLTDRGAAQFPFTPLHSLDTSPLKTQQANAPFSTDPPKSDIKFINPLRSNPIDKAQLAKLAPRHPYDDDSDDEYIYPYVTSRNVDRHVRVDVEMDPELEIELRDCVRRLVRSVLRSDDAKLGDGLVKNEFYVGAEREDDELETSNDLVDEMGWLSALIN